jgi:hypothetical protein
MTPPFFASLDRDKGLVEVIDDDPKNYAFSNIFEVASRAKPFEQIAVAKNFEYVLEAVRAEGVSTWRACAHDQSALVMDGEVEITIRTLRGGHELPSSGSAGVPDDAAEALMGRVIAGVATSPCYRRAGLTASVHGGLPCSARSPS